MALSDEQLREERRKARQMAMMQALSMIESSQSGLCASCSEWQDKLKDESRRSCKEIEHLRGAIQKLVDQLAGFMPGTNLRSFLSQLQLDDRLFTIHGGGDFYKNAPMTLEPPTSNKELQDVIAERDLAKMKWATVGRELNDLKRAHEAVTKQYLERDKDVEERQHSLEQTELKLRALEVSSTRFDDAEARLATLEHLYNSALTPQKAGASERKSLLSSGKLEGLSRASDQQRLEHMEAKIGTVEAQSKRMLVSPGGLKSKSKKPPSQFFEDSNGIDRSYNIQADLPQHMSIKTVGDMAALPDLSAATFNRKLPKQGLPPFETNKVGPPFRKAGGGSHSSLWSLGTSALPDSSMVLAAKDVSGVGSPFRTASGSQSRHVSAS